ncbi:MAG: hypothetical protein L6Q95_14185, partial [Planctomycetes bacterium]|nr:hypothetical protein [Planctomycetota bacterium]
MGTPDLVLVVTDSTNGVLEPCNCTSGMTGGLSRRSGLLRAYRAAFPDLVLVDTGDAFRMGHPRDPRNAFLLRAYRQLGYDAVVLADHEWSTAPSALRELVTRGTPEFLSTTANLGEPPLPVTRVVTRRRGGAKLAILSDAPRTSPPLLTAEVATRLSFAAPRRLVGEVARLKREGHVVVLVSHGVDAEVEEQARATGADLVLQGHYRTGNVVPDRLPDPPVLRVGDFEYVTVLAWKVRDGAVVDFEYRRELVDERWPMDGALWKTYEDYMRVALGHAAAAKVDDGRVYVPSAACGACHEPQHAAWKTSRHAHAYETLLRVGREGDPDCLSCHTTGFESKAGFDSIRKTPELANVNCQDCHRFSMKEHDVPGFVAPKVVPGACTRCHTQTTDPRFDFETRRAAAGCRAMARAPGAVNAA